MAANPTVVPVALTAPVVQVLSASGDFSNLREIKKQLLLIAGLTRERGLLHSSKWWDVGVGRDRAWILALGGLVELIQFAGVFQVRGVGLLPSGVASGRAAAASSYYRGKEFFTANASHQPKRYWVTCHWRGTAECLAGMFVEGIQAFKDLGVLSDFIWVVLLSFEGFGGALKLERIGKQSLRVQPFDFVDNIPNDKKKQRFLQKRETGFGFRQLCVQISATLATYLTSWAIVSSSVKCG